MTLTPRQRYGMFLSLFETVIPKQQFYHILYMILNKCKQKGKDPIGGVWEGRLRRQKDNFGHELTQEEKDWANFLLAGRISETVEPYLEYVPEKNIPKAPVIPKEIRF